jgi:hypothetical protein
VTRARNTVHATTTVAADEPAEEVREAERVGGRPEGERY